MKRAYVTILLLAFMSISLLGVSAMHMDMQNHDGDCLSAAVQRADCPKGNNLLNYLAFHFGAFQVFSNAVFGQSYFNLLFVILFVFVLTLVQVSKLSPPQLCFVYSPYERVGLFKSPFQREILSWLAIHDNSPGDIF